MSMPESAAERYWREKNQQWAQLNARYGRQIAAMRRKAGDLPVLMRQFVGVLTAQTWQARTGELPGMMEGFVQDMLKEVE